ncbi:Dolichyldiphosphatase 1 [Phytophthora palmivora]|uniref:Dolichyldiphosphatase n=1 Tax=Phytophthora palmivora TaxID=4796 RepID=A0A2P4Y6F3_9STRA|nr:Dolichyldiphosphatase 1 [Phytophthora palmivora]
MTKAVESKGKALKAFELTWVMYDPTDRFGVIMALFTLSPVFVTLMHVTLVTFQRDLDSVSMFLGQIVSEVINKVLKKTINQQRPDGARMSGSGMPSAHSQFISYFASYAVAYTSSRLNSHRYIEQWFTIVGCIFLATFTCYSRVRLGYHTKDQVAVGALVGAIVGFAWHAFVSKVSPWLFPVIAQSQLAQFFYLRDISHIPDLIVYQHQLCLSDVAAFKSKFL